MTPVEDLGAFVGPTGVLLAGADNGPLTGSTLGVKDLFDIAGSVTGAGNPTFAATRGPAETTAPAVARLVEAGATVVGKTLTDELAFSLSGTNVHYGTPLNTAAPGHVPGGSSAGSAAAVAGGIVDVALGTDTAGSVRVPASYCGTLGWRSTHGSIPMGGVVPLAPSFDTVGLFARQFDVLLSAASALLDQQAPPPAPRPMRLLDESFADIDPTIATALRDAIASADLDPTAIVSLGTPLDVALAAQRTRQTWEAWQAHGAWIRSAKPILGPGVAARFEAGSKISMNDVEATVPIAERVRARMLDLLADGPLVLPAAAGPPPPVDSPLDRSVHEAQRASTLRLTCAAGLAGAPVVVVPAIRFGGLPLGLAIIGEPGHDLELIASCATLADRFADGMRR